MSIIQGIPDEQVQRAIRHIVYDSANNEERELHFTQMLRDIDVNNGFNKTSAWQTIEEFKGSGFVGLCWILDNDGDVFAHNYDGEYFTNPYIPNYPIHNERIRSVMPIKTPEAPK